MAGKSKGSIASFFRKRGRDSEKNSVEPVTLTATVPVPVAPSSNSCPVPIEAEIVVINHDHDVTTTPPSKKARLAVATPPARTPPLSAKKGKTKQQQLQGFTKGWLTQFDWLAYDAVDNSMHCKLCKKQRGDGVWVTGTRNFRVKTVVSHITGKVSSIYTLLVNLLYRQHVKRQFRLRFIFVLAILCQQEVDWKKYKWHLVFRINDMLQTYIFFL